MSMEVTKYGKKSVTITIKGQNYYRRKYCSTGYTYGSCKCYGSSSSFTMYGSTLSNAANACKVECSAQGYSGNPSFTSSGTSTSYGCASWGSWSSWTSYTSCSPQTNNLQCDGPLYLYYEP